MLAPGDVPAYLVGVGLLDEARIVDGPLTVRVAPGRAHNYLVETGGAGGYFIKQRDSEDRDAHLMNEAAIWEMLQPTSGDGIQEHLPYLRHRDLERGLLVYDLLPDAEDFLARLRRTGRFSRSLNRRLGAFIGKLHRQNPEIVDPSGRLSPAPPWIFDVHKPAVTLLEYSSSGIISLVEEIQRRPDLVALLDGLRERWSGTAIIHGDLKWGNVLVTRSPQPSKDPALTVIDWELGGRGDPFWDVAGILCNYMVLWLASIPVSGDAPIAAGLSQARYPLAMVQPAVEGFWTAYLATRGLVASEADDAVETVTRYTAARLLQWAYENLHDQSAPGRLEMALLDLSCNLSQRPAEGAAHLLSISAAGTAP